MALASSNRAQLRYMLETAFGVTPTVGNPNDLRMTGESLAFALTSDTSKEIRSDRQVTDLILTGASASGGVNFELSYKEFDTLFEAAFMGTWNHFGTDGLGATLSLDIDSAAGTLTASVAPSGANAFTNLSVGQYFKLVAPGDAADGAFLMVGSRTTTVITVSAATPIPGSGSRTAVTGCRLKSSRLTNGVVERSFTIERALEDVGQYFAYRGMALSKLSLSFQSSAIVGGSMDFMGKDSVRGTATTLPGTSVASQTYDIMNAVSGVGNLMENGAPLAGTFIKSLKFDLDNKLRARDAIGTLGAISIGTGTLEVTGEMEVYLNDGSLYDKFVNNVGTSISWVSMDGERNGYAFQFPNVEFNDAKVQAGGLDQDVMLTMPFTAIMDPVTGKTIIMDRL